MGTSTSLAHTPRPVVACDRMESTSVTPFGLSYVHEDWTRGPPLMYMSLHPVYVSLAEPCGRRWYALVALMAAACELEPVSASLIAQSFQLRWKPFENQKTFGLTHDYLLF